MPSAEQGISRPRSSTANSHKRQRLAEVECTAGGHSRNLVIGGCDECAQGFDHTQTRHGSLKGIYLKKNKKALVFQNPTTIITRKLNTSPRNPKYKSTESWLNRRKRQCASQGGQGPAGAQAQPSDFVGPLGANEVAGIGCCHQQS